MEAGQVNWSGPSGGCANLERSALSGGSSDVHCPLLVAIQEFGPRVAKTWSFQEKQGNPGYYVKLPNFEMS